MSKEFVFNAAGRSVPLSINGKNETAFKGLGKYASANTEEGLVNETATASAQGENKVVRSLSAALKACGVKNGMTISTHHHLRNADLVTNTLFDAIKGMGLKDLVWFPSAAFPCHEHLIPYLQDGTINRIEGSISRSLAKFTSKGNMEGVAVFRSYGGRAQAICNGEVNIDVAVLAAPSADLYGNATGQRGPSACGVLSFANPDIRYAAKVIVVTDNLVDFPCVPIEIEGVYVDYVVVLNKIGIPEKVMPNAPKITTSPDRLLIANLVTQFLIESGILKNKCSMQTGAGGISLATMNLIHQYLLDKGWKAKAAYGGSTKYMAQMLEEETLEAIYDSETLDKDALDSLRNNSNHFISKRTKTVSNEGVAKEFSNIDVVILGATEVDVQFNGNVVTQFDGSILHGIGAWQDGLFAKNVVLALPLFRDRVVNIKDEVTTLCGPGELIDVIVTERGIAINPLRKDLMDRMKGSNLPIKTIYELKEEAEAICGIAQKPTFTDEVVAAIKWVDGTVLDVVRKIKE